MARPQAQTRPSYAGLRQLTCAIALACPGVAHAGAWIAEEEGRTITSYGHGMEEGRRTNEFDSYTEAPFSSRTSVVAKTFSRSTFNYDAEQVELALKHSVFRRGRFVVSGQGGATWTDAPEEGCARLGGEARALAGVAFGGGRGFGNFELGARAAQGGCRHVRAEATAGYRPSSRWLVLAQGFADQNLAYEGVFKAQVSAVRFGDEGRGGQIGLRTQFQEGEFIAPTLIVGYWSKPRGGRRSTDA